MAKSDKQKILKITDEKIKFGELFKNLYNFKNDKKIKEYSIAKANLEHVFLYFARFQNDWTNWIQWNEI